MTQQKQRVTYRLLAERACRFEREGLYRDAGDCWERAADVARTAMDRLWASNRADFCHNAQHGSGMILNLKKP